MCLGNTWYVLAVLHNPHLLPTCPMKFLDHHPHTQTLLLRPLRVHDYFNMCSQCLNSPHCSTINNRVVECCGVYQLLNSPCSYLSPFEAQQASFSESSHRHAPDFTFPTHIDTPEVIFNSQFLKIELLLESAFFPFALFSQNLSSKLTFCHDFLHILRF